LQHRSENIFKLPQLFAFFHIVLILLAARILFVLFLLNNAKGCSVKSSPAWRAV
jgi:hypothetical protein